MNRSDPTPDAENNNARGSGYQKNHKTKDSLGLMDLDAVSRFSEASSADVRRMLQSNGTSISANLQNERTKAMETLQRANRKQISRIGRTSTTNDAFNISALVDDKTVDMRSIADTPDRQVSFEPSEMTGRSTMHSKNLNHGGIGKMITTPSVEEILWSSQSEDIRVLGESMRQSINAGHPRPSSVRSQYGEPQQQWRQHPPVNFSVSCASNASDESFTPANLMQSRLMADENDWEQEFAVIPGKKGTSSFSNASVYSNKFNASSKPKDSQRVDLSGFSGIVPHGSDYSIGQFFRDRCEDVRVMIPNPSPEKRNPGKIIESLDGSRNLDYSQEGGNNSDRTFRKDSVDARSIASSTMSVTDIASALKNIAVNDSPNEVVNRLLKQSIRRHDKSPLSEMPTNTSSNRSSLGSRVHEMATQNKRLANKENNPALSDTVSFTESLLNRTEFQEINDYFLEVPHTRKRSHSATNHLKVKVEDRCTQKRSKSPQNTKELQAANGCLMVTPTKTEPKAADYSPRSLASTALSSPDFGTRSLQVSSNANKLRSNSQCSTASDFNQRDGPIPLKSTHNQLSWGSIKLRKSVRKSLQVKNISTKRLVLRMEIKGPGFQIHGDNASMCITLHGLERRTITVSFCPTMIGPAVGKLIFRLTKDFALTNVRAIDLFGYGGNASVQIEGFQRGPIGIPFLPLGELRDVRRNLSQTFVLYNKGPLKAFAAIIKDPKDCHYSSLHIVPNSVIIMPEKAVTVTVTFKPRRDDIKRMVARLADVMSLARLNITYVDEPTRQHLKHIILNADPETQTQRFMDRLRFLTNELESEDELDLSALKLDSASISDLFGTLKEYVVDITLNHTTIDDDTLESTILAPENDETMMFHTLGPNATLLSSTVLDEVTSTTTTRPAATEGISVYPNYLMFNNVDGNSKVLTIRNKFYKRQIFEIQSNHERLFTISARNGEIPLGEEVEVYISLNGNVGPIPAEQIVIKVFVEAERVNVPVFIEGQ